MWADSLIEETELFQSESNTRFNLESYAAFLQTISTRENHGVLCMEAMLQTFLPGMEKVERKELVSVSRRTDIPAYYADWFLQRVRAGWCDVPNPRVRGQVRRVSLKAQDVAGIVFWTRDPRPLLPHLEWLLGRGLDFHWMVTILDYPKSYDRGTPPVESIAKAVQQIARQFGPERVSWRYDPMLFSQVCTPLFHVQSFEKIAQLLEGATRRVIVSLVEEYAKTRARLRTVTGTPLELHCPMGGILQELASALMESARRYGMLMQCCAQPSGNAGGLVAAGVPAGACLDAELFRTQLGWCLRNGKDQGQRGQCRCVSSRDIGMYESCPRGCIYCYAVTDFRQAKANKAAHDPYNTSLL